MSAPDAVALLDPAAVLAAAGDPVRLALLRALAAHAPQSVADLAGHVQRPADGVSKHLRILRAARVITAVTPADTDGRKQYYEIPTLFRSRDTAGRTVLDFGAVAVRLD